MRLATNAGGLTSCPARAGHPGVAGPGTQAHQGLGLGRPEGCTLRCSEGRGTLFHVKQVLRAPRGTSRASQGLAKPPRQEFSCSGAHRQKATNKPRQRQQLLPSALAKPPHVVKGCPGPTEGTARFVERQRETDARRGGRLNASACGQAPLLGAEGKPQAATRTGPSATEGTDASTEARPGDPSHAPRATSDGPCSRRAEYGTPREATIPRVGIPHDGLGGAVRAPRDRTADLRSSWP